ncbi:MAG: hypothetical protein JRJ77_02975 [Deltaproteobacteria bacterium]|nr:hypothetical protein [Deltaproteobacteria bacterium]
MDIFFLDYASHSLDEWEFQNQKKDTHTLDFDVTLAWEVVFLTDQEIAGIRAYRIFYIWRSYYA